MQGFKAFSCMTNCDLAAQWKGLLQGWCHKCVHITLYGLCKWIRQPFHSKWCTMYPMMLWVSLRQSWLDVFPQANCNTRKSCINATGGGGASCNFGSGTWWHTCWVTDNSFWCWDWNSSPKFQMWSSLNSLLCINWNAEAIVYIF